MLGILKIIFFVNINFIIVKCYIPTLSVQKVDRDLIEKQRKESLDMCLIFNAEKNTLKSKPSKIGYRRNKRDVEGNEPTPNIETAKRVEVIVDKLYDELSENGQNVTYRHRILDATTTEKAKAKGNGTERRFNFAPAKLLGPSSESAEKREPKDYPPAPGIQWHKKWKHGIIPYFIDSKTYDSQLADVIRNAFDYFERATCIRLQKLREKPTDSESLKNTEWLYITNPSGIRQCVHSNEKKNNKGVQMVVFGYNCMSTGEILHEVMHVLGFSHEHTRPDRDQHINVLWNNIKPGYKRYFEKRSDDVLMHIPYDYSSVLHYPPRAFSRNGQVTIMSRPGVKLGQRQGLSEYDVEKVGVVFGHECLERNRQYLITTCPSVVEAEPNTIQVSQTEITEYFEDRIWPYGIVNYKIRDKTEFSAEERENIKAVIKHIEMETCIRFKDITDELEKENSGEFDEKSSEIIPSESNQENQPPSSNQVSSEVEKPSGNGQTSTDDKLSSDDQAQNNGQTSDNKPADSEGQISSDTKPSEGQISSSNQATSDGQVSGNIQKLKDNLYLNDNQISSNTKSSSEYKGISENEIKSGTDDTKNNSELDNSELDANLRSGKKKNTKAESRQGSRRHADNILILTRSLDPGCICPPPGRPNGNKVLKINSDCFNSVNDLLHMFVHILGLDHQHNMHDRDSYLHILWQNMTKEVEEEMENKLPPPASVGFSYDYQSVMHYPWLQIKNGVTNIMYPIWNDGWAMGHWQGLSSIDVQKLNKIYSKQCKERRNEEPQRKI